MVGAPTPTERVTEHLLDGQQRLTALWRSLHDDYSNRTYLVRFAPDDAHGGPDIPFVFGQSKSIKDGEIYPRWLAHPSHPEARLHSPASPQP